MDAVIVSTARTPLCKSWKGALNMTHGATMGGHVVKAVLERAKLDPAEVEDVIMGCANPEGATGWNIARQSIVRPCLPRVCTDPGQRSTKRPGFGSGESSAVSSLPRVAFPKGWK